MSIKAFQDYYPENVAHCYGCGRLDEHGHQFKTVWEGEESGDALYAPALPHRHPQRYVYGGLIASLVDCHSTGTAAAAMYRAEGREMDTEPAYRFATASPHVDYLKPTPLGIELVARGRVKRNQRPQGGGGDARLCRRHSRAGEVVAVQMPEEFGRKEE